MKNQRCRKYALLLGAIICMLASSCEYKKPSGYHDLKGRALDSVDYLYKYHVTYGTLLYVRADTLRLSSIPVQGKKMDNTAFLLKGDVLVLTDFKNVVEKKEQYESMPSVTTWVKVVTPNSSGWMPANKLGATAPDAWTRFVPTWSSGEIGPFVLAFLIWISYMIFLKVQKRRAKKTGVEVENSFIFSKVLNVCAIFLGGVWALLMYKNETFDHFYYNPHVFSWSVHPLVIILLMIAVVLNVAAFIAMTIEIFRKKRLAIAAFHWLGCTSAVLLIFFLSVVFSFVIAIIAIGIFALFLFGAAVASGGGKGGGSSSGSGFVPYSTNSDGTKYRL